MLFRSLQRRAEMRAEEGLAGMARAQRQCEDLRSALKRLERLEQEYAERLRSVETAPHRLAINIGHRLYMDQLHQLRSRINASLADAESAYRKSHENYLSLLRDCERTRLSQERILADMKVARMKTEARRLDDLGVATFTARRRRSPAKT